MANPKSLQDYPDMLNAKMVSEILSVGYTKALNLIKYELSFIKIGNTYRVHRGKFEKWLEECHKREIVFDKQ